MARSAQWFGPINYTPRSSAFMRPQGKYNVVHRRYPYPNGDLKWRAVLSPSGRRILVPDAPEVG